MSDTIRPPGITTIAPDVLIAIARLTALRIPGVKRLVTIPGGMSLFKKDMSEGVKINVEKNIVNAELFLMIQRGMNIREVSRMVQQNVARAISEMVGMEVGKVNIHVEDIDCIENHES